MTDAPNVPEYWQGERLEEGDLLPEYRKWRDEWREGAGGRFFLRGRELAESIRTKAAARILDGQMKEGDPLPAYLAAEYDQALERLDREAKSAALGMLGQLENQRQNAFSLLHDLSQSSPELITRAISTPPEELEFALEVAGRAPNWSSLAKTLAVTAKHRGRVDLFRKWAQSREETARALETLERTPSYEQAWDQIVTPAIPAAASERDLVPKTADIERVRESRRNAEVARRMEEAQAEQRRGGRGFPFRRRLSPLDAADERSRRRDAS